MIGGGAFAHSLTVPLFYTLIISAYSQTDYSSRLVNGNTNHEGMVEIYTTEGSYIAWRSVCGDQWDMNDANVVCKSLNFISAISALPDYHIPRHYSLASSLRMPYSQFECAGTEHNLGLCKRVYLGSQESCQGYAGVICGDTIPNDYDVQIVGGPNAYTGQVQIYVNGRWRNICTCNQPECWSTSEATTVCRTVGYEGAFALKGEVVASGLDNEAPPISMLNCRDMNDPVSGSSDFVKFCQTLEIDEYGRCGGNHVPRTVTCNQKLEELQGRLEYIKGQSESYQLNKGYVRIKHGTNYYFVCADDSWNQTAANIFCRSMGLEPSDGLPDLSPITDWDTGELYAIMSHVRCSEDTSSLLECSHRFGLVTCPDNRFATANCVAVEVVTHKQTITPYRPPEDGDSSKNFTYVLFITGMIAILFLTNIIIAIVTMRKKCDQPERGTRQLAPSYSSVMRDEHAVQEMAPPPNYSFVVKPINLDPSDGSLAPTYSTVLRENQLARTRSRARFPAEDQQSIASSVLAMHGITSDQDGDGDGNDGDGGGNGNDGDGGGDGNDGDGSDDGDGGPSTSGEPSGGKKTSSVEQCEVDMPSVEEPEDQLGVDRPEDHPEGSSSHVSEGQVATSAV